MAIPVEMPKMSDTMEEGVLVSWLVDEGAAVSAGDIIAQVETDKATMDLEVYDDGVLLKKVIVEGDAVPIGGLIAILGKDGEDISAILDKYGSDASGDGQAGPAPADRDPVIDTAASPGTRMADVAEVREERSEGGRVKASPLARRLAKEHGLDLGRVRGSGPEGRIVKRDIEVAIGKGVAPSGPATAPTMPAAAPAAPSATPAPVVQKAPTYVPSQIFGEEEPSERVRISQMRKAIAKRLAQSKYSSPHFYLTVDVAMDRAVQARVDVNELAEKHGLPKISFNDIITKACAVALRQHQAVNASYMEEQGEIHYHRQVHVAVAVAVDEGLITPVIRNADLKGLGQIAIETRELADRARARELQPEEYEGSTFTTSNLGMFGIEEFTAIINPPNACILAIGTIRDVPVVEGGEVKAGKRMKLTLSCDHRVVDGATGARFLDSVTRYLEEPLTLLL